MRKAYEIGFGTTDNELVLDRLNVKGRIPNWVEGTLLRNGPGRPAIKITVIGLTDLQCFTSLHSLMDKSLMRTNS